jgi:dCTP deaminase
MVLNDKDIQRLIAENKLIISPPPVKDDFGSVSIKLHLAEKILKYKDEIAADLKKEETFEADEVVMSKSGYRLEAGEFILGSTQEEVTIPNGYFGFIQTRGNIARAGIQTNNADAHVDPGFSGHLNLEIKNNSNRPIIIYPGIAFVKLYLFKTTSKSTRPYKGKYQGQKGATVYRRS